MNGDGQIHGWGGNSGISSSVWNRILLVMILIGAGIAMFYFGTVARIEYDGWWHVFIARESNWSIFLRDIFVNAHPPLYFLVLKFSSFCFGYSRIAYRIFSIFAGVISVFLVARIVEKTCLVRATTLLATLAFAASTTTIIIANEVRSYMLAGTFLLFSLYFFLDLVGSGSKRLRSQVCCSTGLVLGVLSHYSLLFVIPAFFVVPIVLSMCFPATRKRISQTSRKNWTSILMVLIAPTAMAAAAFVFHIRKFSKPMGHLSEFYYSSSEPLPAYIWRVATSELALFSPVNLSRTPFAYQALGFVLLSIGVVVLLLLLRMERAPRAAAIPILTLVLAGELLFASITGRYPFGGALRHQYIVFPIALISLFLLLDRMLARMPSRSCRAIAGMTILFVLVISSSLQWHSLRIVRNEIATGTHRVFRTEFPYPSSVYLDQFSLIIFFSHEHKATWQFESTFDKKKIDKIRIQRDNHEFFVLRNRKAWQAHLDDPKVFRGLTRALAAFGLDQTIVYHFDRVRTGEEASRRVQDEGDQQRLQELGAVNGLSLIKVLHPPGAVFAQFERVE